MTGQDETKLSETKLTLKDRNEPFNPTELAELSALLHYISARMRRVDFSSEFVLDNRADYFASMQWAEHVGNDLFTLYMLYMRKVTS